MRDVSTSSVPVTTSVGTSSDPSRSVASWARQYSSWLRYACWSGGFSAIRRSSPAIKLRNRAEGLWREDEMHGEPKLLGKPEALDQNATGLENAPRPQIGRGVGRDEHQRRDPLRRPQRKLLSDHPAHRHAYNVCALNGWLRPRTASRSAATRSPWYGPCGLSLCPDPRGSTVITWCSGSSRPRASAPHSLGHAEAWHKHDRRTRTAILEVDARAWR